MILYMLSFNFNLVYMTWYTIGIYLVYKNDEKIDCDWKCLIRFSLFWYIMNRIQKMVYEPFHVFFLYTTGMCNVRG